MNHHQPFVIIPDLPMMKNRNVGQLELQRIGKRRQAEFLQEDEDDWSRMFDRDVSSSAYSEANSDSDDLLPPCKKAKCIDYVWKEDKRLDAIRSQMQSVLEQHVKKKCSESNPALAVALEKLLFNRATSVRDYLCLDSLDTKLKSILAALLERKLRKAEKVDSRPEALVKALGDEKKYGQVAFLVDEIKRLRTGHQTTGSKQNSFSAKSSSNSNGPSSSSSSCKFLVEPHDTKMAPPVKALFFETELVTAFDLTPTDELTSLNWDRLITNAEAVVANFCDWVSSSSS